MYRTSYDSPLGKMYMSGDGKYLTGLWFVGSRDSSKHGQDFEDGELPVFDETKKWLDIYFSGKDPGFTPEYKLENLTDFRRMVVEEMNSIPYGHTVTYNDIARKIAEKKGLKKMSAQAVGGAVGWNPICIIIPCHRVVGSNGSLTGYGGGIQNKVGLLTLEKNDMSRFTVPTKGTAL